MKFEDWRITASDWNEQNPFHYRNQPVRATFAPATNSFFDAAAAAVPNATHHTTPIVTRGCIFYLQPNFYRYSGVTGPLDPTYKTYPLLFIEATIPKLTAKTFLSFFARLLQYHNETGGKIQPDKLSAACEALLASEYKKSDCPRGGLVAWLLQLDSKVHEWKTAFMRSEYVFEILIGLEAPLIHKWFNLDDMIIKPWDELMGLERFLTKNPQKRLKLFVHPITSVGWQESQEFVEAMDARSSNGIKIEQAVSIKYGVIHSPAMHDGAWYEFPLISLETLFTRRTQRNSTTDVEQRVNKLNLTADEFLQWSLSECMMKDAKESACSSFRMNSFSIVVGEGKKRPLMKLEFRVFRKPAVVGLYVLFHRMFLAFFPFDAARFWSEEEHDSVLRLLYREGHVVMTYESKSTDAVLCQVQQRRAERDGPEFYVTPTYYWRNVERISKSMCRIQMKATERHLTKKCVSSTSAAGMKAMMMTEEVDEDDGKAISESSNSGSSSSSSSETVKPESRFAATAAAATATTTTSKEDTTHILDLNTIVIAPRDFPLSAQQHTLIAAICNNYAQPLIISDSPAGCGKTTCLRSIKGADEKDIWMEDPKRKVRIRAECWLCTNTNQLASFLSTLLKRPVQTTASTTESMRFSLKRFEHVNILVNDELGLQSEIQFGDWIEYASYLQSLQRVVMTGDHAQIPSIEPGNVIEDLAKFALASERKPCAVYPLTQNFRQGADSSQHISDLRKGHFPKFTTVDVSRAGQILEDIAAYETGVRATAVLGPARGFSPFMIDMYQGWETYQYIFEVSKRVGWHATHVVVSSHKMRMQTNRALGFLCGYRGDTPPRLDHWRYDGARQSRDGSAATATIENQSTVHVRANGRSRNNNSRKKSPTPKETAAHEAVDAAEEGVPADISEEATNIDEVKAAAHRHRKQDARAIHPLHAFQKIQFRNNRDLPLMIPDPDQDGQFLMPDDKTPVKRMNRNRVSIIHSIFNCTGGVVQEVVDCTTDLSFSRGTSACLTLVDCDDVEQEPYSVEVPFIVFKRDIGRGYCSTVDSAQGTQRTIIFALIEPMALKKRMYTTFSRGVKAGIGFFCPYDNRGKKSALANHLDSIRQCFLKSEPQRITAMSSWLSHDVEQRSVQEKRRAAAAVGKKRAREPSTMKKEPPVELSLSKVSSSSVSEEATSSLSVSSSSSSASASSSSEDTASWASAFGADDDDL